MQKFDVLVDFNDGLMRIMTERKCEKKLGNKILINRARVPLFLDKKVRLKQNQAVVVTKLVAIDKCSS